jgi:aminoglycoside phosphotransferase (APT) family kinase protein
MLAPVATCHSALSPPPSQVMAAPATLRLLRRRPPQQTLSWLLSVIAPGGSVRTIRPLRAATARAVHAVEIITSSGESRRVVLRRFVPTPGSLLDPDMDVSREMLILRFLEHTAVPAPRVLGADPDATATDVPAIVLERLPGAPPRTLPDLEKLIGLLATIHSLDGAAEAGVPAHRRWNDPMIVEVPDWGTDAGLWRSAVDVARSPAPAGPPTFIHRDFHPGNTLWRRGQLTGIVDWTAASVGPAAVDLAHVRWNLAVDHGQEAAEAALVPARARGVAHEPYWDVAEVVDLLADSTPSRPPPGRALERLEDFIRRALAALR